MGEKRKGGGDEGRQFRISYMRHFPQHPSLPLSQDKKRGGRNSGSYLHFPLSLLPHSTVPLWLPPTKAVLIANLLLLLCHKFVRQKNKGTSATSAKDMWEKIEGQFSPLPLGKRERGGWGKKSAFKSRAGAHTPKTCVLNSPGGWKKEKEGGS